MRLTPRSFIAWIVRAKADPGSLTVSDRSRNWRATLYSRFFRLDLHGRGLVRQWSNETCSGRSASDSSARRGGIKVTGLIGRWVIGCSRKGQVTMTKPSCSRNRVNSPVAIFSDSDGDLGLDDGVDTSDFVGDFPSALEEQGLVDGSWHGHDGTGSREESRGVG